MKEISNVVFINGHEYGGLCVIYIAIITATVSTPSIYFPLCTHKTLYT